LRKRLLPVQGVSICEDEFLESHKWLTDDLRACTIGSSQKAFLLIDPNLFRSEPVLLDRLPGEDYCRPRARSPILRNEF
jgi:hypothetical protein